MHKKKIILFYILVLSNVTNAFSITAQSESIKKDSLIKLKFGGRIVADYAYFNQNSKLNNEFEAIRKPHKTEFRRLRLFSSGTFFKNFEYKLSVDFAEEKLDIKDAYIGVSIIPFFDKVRIGHIKEPFRLDVLNSSKYITFIERSFSSDFMDIRNYGMLIFKDFLNKKISFQMGYFLNHNNPSTDKNTTGGNAFTSRISGLLIQKEEKLLHIGFGHSYRTSNSKEFKVSSTPEVNLSPYKYINSGKIMNVKKSNLFNFEAVYILNSLAIQSEYLFANITTSSKEYNFSTYYGEISYFLTGEKKVYKNSYGGFGKIIPTKNFSFEEGLGTLQIAARYSYSNLNNQDVLGGAQSNLSLGFNWFPNTNTRFSINHIWASIKTNKKASILSARFQLEF